MCIIISNMYETLLRDTGFVGYFQRFKAPYMNVLQYAIVICFYLEQNI